MTVTAEAPAGPQVIPLDQLTRRIDRAIGRLQPPDLRPRLLQRLRAGLSYPLDPAATELGRDDTIVFIRHLMMSTGPEDSCIAGGGLAPACKPDTCRPCKARAAAYAGLLDLIASELDALEAELSGFAEPEPVSPDPGKWYLHCQECGQRFLTSSKLARYCTEACRKRSSRAAQAREQAARLSQEQSQGVRDDPRQGGAGHPGRR